MYFSSDRKDIASLSKLRRRTYSRINLLLSALVSAWLTEKSRDAPEEVSNKVLPPPVGLTPLSSSYRDFPCHVFMCTCSAWIAAEE